MSFAEFPELGGIGGIKATGGKRISNRDGKTLSGLEFFSAFRRTLLAAPFFAWFFVMLARLQDF